MYFLDQSIPENTVFFWEGLSCTLAGLFFGGDIKDVVITVDMLLMMIILYTVSIFL